MAPAEPFDNTRTRHVLVLPVLRYVCDDLLCPDATPHRLNAWLGRFELLSRRRAKAAEEKGIDLSQTPQELAAESPGVRQACEATTRARKVATKITAVVQDESSDSEEQTGPVCPGGSEGPVDTRSIEEVIAALEDTEGLTLFAVF